MAGLQLDVQLQRDSSHPLNPLYRPLGGVLLSVGIKMATQSDHAVLRGNAYLARIDRRLPLQLRGDIFL